MSAWTPATNSSAESIVDALLPNRSDPNLVELGAATFIDAGVEVPVSPADLLLMALARQLINDPGLGGAAVVQLPRAKHRAALVLAITSHLLCRQTPTRLSGPVVLIGFDVDLVTQLRTLSVRNHRRMGLADGNPLGAHRLTRAGHIEPLIGQASRPVDRSLIYFNTRVGRPPLACNPPLVILDATSVAHPAARTRALEWALERDAVSVIAVGDIGDDSLVGTVTATGLVPVVLPFTDQLGNDLVDTFGCKEPTPSTLCTQAVLWCPSTTLSVHRVGDDDVNDDVNDAVARAFQAIASKPAGPPPHQLDVAMKLLRNGTRLAARVRDYKTACSYNVRPGELPVPRLLDRTTAPLQGAWRPWEVASFGALKAALRTLWQILEDDNPKLTELWRVLDHLERTRTGDIVIRCHSAAAAEATRMSLCAGERTPAQEQLWSRIQGRVTTVTFKDRIKPGTVDAQILTSPPPPWLFSVLVGIEAPETHVLVYEAEEAVLLRQGERWAAGATGWQNAAARTFGAPAPDPVGSPLPATATVEGTTAATSLQVPGLSLAEVLDVTTSVIDPSETAAAALPSTHFGGDVKTCVPVRLDDGRAWWCIDGGDRSTPVVRITAAGHEHCPVGELRAGDCIVVPAGEGTESIHARLVAATRTNADVRSLDLILSQFRAAARHLLLTARTQREAVERVRVAGGEAPDQLPAWAQGTTIAPREPGDVRAVFDAAGRTCPDLNLIYAVAGALRSLNRTLGKFIAVVASGRGEDAVERLRDLVGPVADELIDEFVVATVTGVDATTTAPAHFAGKVR